MAFRKFVGRRFKTRVAAPVESGSPYLVSEDFETDYSGPPTGWSNETGTPDYHYGTSPLRGSYSFKINNTNQTTSCSFTETADVWFFALIDQETATLTPFKIYHDSTLLLQIGRWSYNAPNQSFRVSNGVGRDDFPNLSGVDFTSAPYYIWIHYQAGSANNTSLTIYASANTTRGSAIYSVTNWPPDLNPNCIKFTGEGSDKGKLDYVRISASEIGDAPA